MLKTKKIENEVRDIKKELKFEKQLYIDYGSFYKKDKKYINDIDINCLFKNDLVDRIDDIKIIINKIDEDPKYIFKKFYIGHLNYYYRDKYTLSYFNGLKKKGIIKAKDLKMLEKYMENKIPFENLKEKVSDILNLSWTIKEINDGFKIVDNQKYQLVNCLEKDNFIWFDLIRKIDKKMIPIEFIIMTYKDFNSSKGKDNKYIGCKIPLMEFILENYYKFIKRLVSCYGVNIKRLYYKKMKLEDQKYIIKAYDRLTKLLKREEEFISKYHMNNVKYILENKNTTALYESFNNRFESEAIKFFNEGIEHNLIY